MGLADANTVVMKEATEFFIDYRQEDVVLNRPTMTPDGMGGILQTSPSALSPQPMRLVPARSITEQAPVRITVEGQRVIPNWYLVGMPDANIRVADTATVRGHKLEVVYVSAIPLERVVAECWENV